MALAQAWRSVGPFRATGRRGRLSAGVLAVMTVAALLTGLAGQPAHAELETPAAPDRPLRVMSFNIHHGAGVDGRLDLERIARVIADHDVEVAGLQEVDRHFSSRSDFADQAAWLAERLNMHVVYGANLSWNPLEPDDPRREYGTAILSRFPILEWSNTFLPKRPNAEQRGLLYARINVRGVPLRMYNTHLQHTTRAERMAQVTKIRELIGAPDEPVLLVGDLNAPPQAPEIVELTQVLADTWDVAGEGLGHTYPTRNPIKRIDYVLSSSDVTTRAATVVATPSSDHLPLLAEVALPGSEVGVGS